jgi:hypothetical protein
MLFHDFFLLHFRLTLIHGLSWTVLILEFYTMYTQVEKIKRKKKNFLVEAYLRH